MQITNHKLDGCWKGPSPNSGGALTNPTILVMHFTASGGAGPQGVRNYFLNPAAKAAAHVIVGRDGTVEQVVAFNVRGWHAGKSIWRGKPNCNDFSIGIEIDNWGALTKTEDGKFRSYTKAVVPPALVTQARHKFDGVMRYWEIYEEKQLDALTEVTRAILAAYPSIKEIVGHDDIAPGRKSDPGPAFPMSRFTSLVAGRGDQPSVKRKVIASSLNLRGGAGMNYEVLGQLKSGDTVTVLYDAPGAWAQVSTTLGGQSGVIGWVADQYLR